MAVLAFHASEREVGAVVRSAAHDGVEILARAGGRAVDELAGLVGIGAHDTEKQTINALAELPTEDLLEKLTTATTSADVGRILIAYGKHGDPEEAIVGVTCDIGSKKVLGERQDWRDLLVSTAVDQYGGRVLGIRQKAQNFATYLELTEVRGGVVLAPVYQTACLDID